MSGLYADVARPLLPIPLGNPEVVFTGVVVGLGAIAALITWIVTRKRNRRVARAAIVAAVLCFAGYVTCVVIGWTDRPARRGPPPRELPAEASTPTGAPTAAAGASR